LKRRCERLARSASTLERLTWDTTGTKTKPAYLKSTRHRVLKARHSTDITTLYLRRSLSLLEERMRGGEQHEDS
jgi:hypothetical protein